MEQEKREQKARELEKQKEEEERLRKEEEARREQEEYERLKAEFAVEEEGYDESESAEDGEGLLKRFMDYIKVR
jgi:hypothetical protein